MTQQIIVFLILSLTVAFLIRGVIRMVKRTDKCSGGCCCCPMNCSKRDSQKDFYQPRQ